MDWLVTSIREGGATENPNPGRSTSVMGILQQLSARSSSGLGTVADFREIRWKIEYGGLFLDEEEAQPADFQRA